MNSQTQKALIKHLSTIVTPERWAKIEEVMDQRTNYINVVVENLYQPHNASAVIRSCDCFGVQTLHTIENSNKFTTSADIAAGSLKWVDIVQHNQSENNTLATIERLKANGYRIIATTPHTNDCNINDLSLEAGKMALFFGTEMHGLTQEMMDHADEFVKIPMYGFTESFNISVSAALILNDLVTRLRSSKINWKLNDSEKLDIQLRWLERSIKGSDKIIKDFLNHV